MQANYEQQNDIANKLNSIFGRRTGHSPEYRYAICPKCGGSKSNPPLSVNIESGKYYCHSCQKGGSITKLIGKLPKSSNQTRTNKDKKTSDRKPNPVATWNGCEVLGENSRTLKHLMGRGILEVTVAGLPIRENGKFGCVIAFTDKKEKVVALNYIIFNSKTDKPNKRYQGKKSLGVAILKNSQKVIVAEGLVTGLSALQEIDDSTYGLIVCGDAGNMASLATEEKRWVLDKKSEILICCDNDANGAGQEAAMKVYSKYPQKSILKIPFRPNTDWNDVLTAERWEEEWNS